MLKHKVLLFGLLVATAACERPVPPTSGEEASYNLSAYLQQQISQLQETQPMILKTVETDGKPSETIQTPQVDWADELAIFQEVDLSKPSLNDFYTQTQETLANGNTEISFIKLEGATAPVQTLRLELSPEKQLQRLEAMLLQKNRLFYTKRNVLLITNPASGNISSYSVEGQQKLIMGDTLHYSIHTNL